MAARSSDPASPHFRFTQRFEQFLDRMLQHNHRDPRAVARLIAHVATCEQPALRYLVGVDAKAEAALKGMLPARAYEAIVLGAIRKIIGADRAS